MSLPTKIFHWKKNPALKSVGLYTVSNFLTKSVSFLLVFIFTDPRYITPSENGVLSLFNNAVIFLKPVMMLGVIHSAGVDYFQLDKHRFRDSFTSGFFLSFIIGLISLVFFWMFRNYLYHTFGFGLQTIIIIPVLTFFIFCFDQFQNILRSENRPERFMGISVSRLFIEVALSVILVVVFSWSWYGRAMGMLFSHGTLAVAAVIYFWRRGYLKGNIKKEHLGNELKFALPVIMFQLVFFTINSSDKFILSHFSGSESDVVGVYSIASIFASVIFTLHHALIQYVFPKIFSTLASEIPDYASIRKHFLFYGAAMAVMTLILILGTPLLYRLFIHSLYFPALKYHYLFCLGYFLWSIAYFFFSFLLFRKDRKKIFFLSFAGVAIAFTLIYFSIQKWSAWGGAFGVFAGCLLICSMTMISTRKEMKRMVMAKGHAAS